MTSIDLHLDQHVKKGLLKFHSAHPTEYGLEQHLVTIDKTVREFKPSVVVIDPITNLISVGVVRDVKAMLMRLIDMLHAHGVTVMFTALALSNTVNDQPDESISSLVDAWITVRDVELNAERNRGLFIMKSRGMYHSKQVREFVINSKGVDLLDVYLGPNGVLIGSAREAQKLQLKGGGTLNEKVRNKMATLRQHDGYNNKRNSKRS
jgi:circadian clock protein KaiC